jgi:hypothetical protein
MRKPSFTDDSVATTQDIRAIAMLALLKIGNSKLRRLPGIQGKAVHTKFHNEPSTDSQAAWAGQKDKVVGYA